MSDWHRKRGLPTPEEAIVLLTLPAEIQRSDHDCGDAALRCVAAFHGFSPSVVRRLATAERGTSPEQVEAELKRLGMRVISGEMDIADLKHYCDRQRPPIVVVHWPDSDDSHWIVCRGVSRNHVYYHDVADGLGKKSAAEFTEAWQAAGRVGVYRRWAVIGWV